MHNFTQDAHHGQAQAHAQKESPQAGNSEGANVSKHLHSTKNTATIAQLQRALELLRLRPHHTHELAQRGLYHPPARIKNLRDCGFEIKTHRITLTDSWGFQHKGVGLYELLAEPDNANALLGLNDEGGQQ